MAEVLLFHHVQGLTDGVRAFADELRAGGHTVHTPDLFEGERPATLEEGVALRAEARRRGARRAGRPGRGRPARRAWCTPASPGGGPPSGWPRPGPARAARCSTSPACRSPASGRSGRGRTASRCRSTAWTQDPFFALEGDLDAARELVAPSGPSCGELFVYPGDRHLFTDSSLPSYDADATALVLQRSRELLDRVG